jgi:hypothetical protein
MTYQHCVGAEAVAVRHRVGGWVIHFPFVVCTRSPSTLKSLCAGVVAGNRTGSRVLVALTWARQRIPLNPVHRVSTTAPRKSAMRQHDLSAKYLVLPPTINIKDIVIAVNTKMIEHCGEPFDDRSSTE